jgi:hypothetical protein
MKKVGRHDGLSRDLSLFIMSSAESDIACSEGEQK